MYMLVENACKHTVELNGSWHIGVEMKIKTIESDSEVKPVLSNSNNNDSKCIYRLQVASKFMPVSSLIIGEYQNQFEIEFQKLIIC